MLGSLLLIEVTLLQTEPLLPGEWGACAVRGSLCGIGVLSPVDKVRWPRLRLPCPRPLLGTLPLVWPWPIFITATLVWAELASLTVEPAQCYKKKGGGGLCDNQEMALESDWPPFPKKPVNTSKWNQVAGPPVDRPT